MTAMLFFRGREVGSQEAGKLMESFATKMPGNIHDQYRHYPSTIKSGWINCAISRLNMLMQNEEWLFFYEEEPFNLLACRISRWDEEHFGFKMAFINLFITEGNENGPTNRLLNECLTLLREQGVKFISARIAGDDLDSIHVFERAGFSYYETIIWPVLNLVDVEPSGVPNVRPMVGDDIERVLEIAGAHQFKRSHYHADRGFDARKVDEMHAKWANTSWHNGEPAAVIEHSGLIAGYFAFKIDEGLSAALGYRYARMRSLTLDSSFRGKGLGAELFRGTIDIMKNMGAQMVDSGYSSKNHKSARLHVLNHFIPAYEEVTLHKWLK